MLISAQSATSPSSSSAPTQPHLTSPGFTSNFSIRLVCVCLGLNPGPWCARLTPSHRASVQSYPLAPGGKPCPFGSSEYVNLSRAPSHLQEEGEGEEKGQDGEVTAGPTPLSGSVDTQDKMAPMNRDARVLYHAQRNSPGSAGVWHDRGSAWQRVSTSVPSGHPL